MAEPYKPKRGADLSVRRLSDEETVILAPTGSVLVLNEVGAALLDLCDGTRTVDELDALLCETLRGAIPETVREDVRTFLRVLSDSGCIVEAP